MIGKFQKSASPVHFEDDILKAIDCSNSSLEVISTSKNYF